MPRFPSAQGRLNHDPGFHLSCDENLSEGWGPPLGGGIMLTVKLAVPSGRLAPGSINNSVQQYIFYSSAEILKMDKVLKRSIFIHISGEVTFLFIVERAMQLDPLVVQHSI